VKRIPGFGVNRICKDLSLSGKIFLHPFGFKVWLILRNVQRYPFGYNKLHLEPK
jgi:hypothetical protein